jgi:hypothetical protein
MSLGIMSDVSRAPMSSVECREIKVALELVMGGTNRVPLTRRRQRFVPVLAYDQFCTILLLRLYKLK